MFSLFYFFRMCEKWDYDEIFFRENYFVYREITLRNFEEMFHTKILQNGNYMTWKRSAIEMFTQNCSDFAKKKIRNIRYVQKQFTFQIFVYLIQYLITSTFRISIKM